MTQPAKTAQPVRDVLDGVTVMALQNNIKLRYGYLHHTVEEAFEKWLQQKGYTAFLMWLKECKNAKDNT